MALTLDDTMAGTSANSYVDITYADDYFSGHYNTTLASQWSAFTDAQKTTLLLHACRVIETARFTLNVSVSEYQLHYDRITGQVLDISMNLQPVKYYYYQKLQFPRNIDLTPPTPGNAGTLYIPEAILQAQCEQAIYLANLDQTAMATRLQGVTQETTSVGRNQIHISQTFSSEFSMYAPMALELISPYLIRGTHMRRA